MKAHLQCSGQTMIARAVMACSKHYIKADMRRAHAVVGDIFGR